MEIKMKTCPRCGKEYNPKFFPVCPKCYGKANGDDGISHTVPVNESMGNTGFGGQPTSEMYQGNFRTEGFAHNQSFAPAGGNGVTEAVPMHQQSFGNGYYRPESFDKPTEIGGPEVGYKKMPPVVGWLVAVSGELCGTDYRIHSNYNSVGRVEGDIVINGDMKISRENDCAILYHVQSGRYFIEHRGGTNAISVNKEPVVGGASELQAYDVITIGDTELLFIPLCGERFRW